MHQPLSGADDFRRILASEESDGLTDAQRQRAIGQQIRQQQPFSGAVAFGMMINQALSAKKSIDPSQS